MGAIRDDGLDSREAKHFACFPYWVSDDTYAAMQEWLESDESGCYGRYTCFRFTGCGSRGRIRSETAETTFAFEDLSAGVMFKLRFSQLLEGCRASA